jgi:hypothetical protein
MSKNINATDKYSEFKIGDLVIFDAYRTQRQVGNIVAIDYVNNIAIVSDSTGYQDTETTISSLTKVTNIKGSMYVRAIAGTNYNNYGFDVYVCHDESAKIVPQKLAHDLPKKFHLKFKSIFALEYFLERMLEEVGGSDVGLIRKLTDTLIFESELDL